MRKEGFLWPAVTCGFEGWCEHTCFLTVLTLGNWRRRDHIAFRPNQQIWGMCLVVDKMVGVIFTIPANPLNRSPPAVAIGLASAHSGGDSCLTTKQLLRRQALQEEESRIACCQYDKHGHYAYKWNKEITVGQTHAITGRKKTEVGERRHEQGYLHLQDKTDDRALC